MPEIDQRELQQRFASGDDRAFDSVFFELYTHELLRATGHRILSHPELPTTSKRPDFLATDNLSATVVECTVATELTTEERSAQARSDVAYDIINQVDCPDYFLSLDTIGTPNTPVPSSQWRAQIQSWIDALDYEEILILGEQQRFELLPSLELSHDGLQLTIQPIAKKQSARGKSGGRPIGAEMSEGRWVQSRHDIRDSVKKKAYRYGELKRPFVVAVNCIGEDCDSEEIEAAFYGDDGLWRSGTHPSFTRLSAVLAVQHLFPWSVASAAVRLFHNPHAQFPYSGTLENLPHARLIGGIIQESGGIHPRVHLQLSQSWPCA